MLATELVGGPLDRRHGHRGDLAVERHDDGPEREHDDHGRGHDDGGAHDHGGAPATYTVVSGDGWYAIAKKVDVPVDSLLQANGATLSTPLHVGEVLKVPPKAPPTT